MATGDSWSPPNSNQASTTVYTRTLDIATSEAVDERQAACTTVYNRTPDIGISEAVDGRQAVTPLSVVLLGATGTGKSATGNTLLGVTKFESSPGLNSVTGKCNVAEVDRFGTRLVVVDTPGVLDTEMSERNLKVMLKECTDLACPGVHAFLFLMKIGDRNIDNKDQRTFVLLKKMFGEKFLDHTIVVFTAKECLGNNTLDQFVSDLPPTFQDFIVSCNGGYLAVSNFSTQEQTAKQVVDKVKNLVQVNDGNHYKNILFDQENEKIRQRMIHILEVNEDIKNKIEQAENEKQSLIASFNGINPTNDQSMQLKAIDNKISKLRETLIDRKQARLKAHDAIQFKKYVKTALKVGAVVVILGIGLYHAPALKVAGGKAIAYLTGNTVGGTAVGGTAVGGTAVGGTAVGGTAVGGTAVGGTAVGGTAVGGTIGGTAVGGTAVGGTAVGGTLCGTAVGGTIGGTAVGGTAVGGTLGGTAVGGTIGGTAVGGTLGGTAVGGTAVGGTAVGGTLGGTAIGGTAVGGTAVGGTLGGTAVGGTLGGTAVGGTAVGGTLGGTAVGGTAVGGTAVGGTLGGTTVGGTAVGGTAVGGTAVGGTLGCSAVGGIALGSAVVGAAVANTVLRRNGSAVVTHDSD